MFLPGGFMADETQEKVLEAIEVAKATGKIKKGELSTSEIRARIQERLQNATEEKRQEIKNEVVEKRKEFREMAVNEIKERFLEREQERLERRLEQFENKDNTAAVERVQSRIEAVKRRMERTASMDDEFPGRNPKQRKQVL